MDFRWHNTDEEGADYQPVCLLLPPMSVALSFATLQYHGLGPSF